MDLEETKVESVYDCKGQEKIDLPLLEHQGVPDELQNVSKSQRAVRAVSNVDYLLHSTGQTLR